MSPMLCESIGPPMSVGSPFQSCQAQKLAPGVLSPSGVVLVGDTTTYCALRFRAAEVLPKWLAASMASWPSWCSVADCGAAARWSTQIPASAPPVGYPTCGASAGQVCAFFATPSQYCVVTPDHSSLPVPTPLNSCCNRAAMPAGSPDSAVLPLASVLDEPHWVPQKTRNTFGVPVVTPMPSTAPPNIRFAPDAVGAAGWLARESGIRCSASRVSY